MQAIILAAGKSTRTYPLTLTRPKPLLTVAGKTLLEHNLEQLNGIVDEVIIVVGYFKEQIFKKIGNKYNKLKVKYVEQKKQEGTAQALRLTKHIVKGTFLVLNGDDLYCAEDIQRAAKKKYCVLVKEVDNPSNFGVCKIDGKLVKEIVEKPTKQVSNLAATGLYVLGPDIFNLKLSKSQRAEFELPSLINELIDQGTEMSFEKVMSYWMPIVYPWDLLDANSHLLHHITESELYGKIGTNVTIDGNLVLGEGSELLNGVYIEGNVIIGDFCKIGPNCYIRGNTTIGERCHIGQAVEIKNSIIMDNSKIPHLSYVGDSVIGSDVNLGAGTITANLRHDNGNIKSMVKGKLIDTGRRKLGAIIGDNVHTGINTSIYPGRKIWPNQSTPPSEVVKKDMV
ncbi:NTP transferase domain-containing protein [Candidatus Woesearchaeota archaeon]|nr:NTP transferase domain-containing protein [Candidatus Woesearchaeota archaeon]